MSAPGECCDEVPDLTPDASGLERTVLDQAGGLDAGADRISGEARRGVRAPAMVAAIDVMERPRRLGPIEARGRELGPREPPCYSQEKRTGRQ